MSSLTLVDRIWIGAMVGMVGNDKADHDVEDE